MTKTLHSDPPTPQSSASGAVPPYDPSDLEKLVTWQMPYDKHKGQALADLPGNYLKPLLDPITRHRPAR